MSKKFRFLLLDANIVIELHRLNLWKKVVEKCEILLPETVIAESKFVWQDEDRMKIDLEPDLSAGRIRKLSCEAAALAKFKSQFDPTYLERLDPGESEALTYLTTQSENHFLCSADAIVYKVLGRLRLSHQGISLEEILVAIGLGRRVDWQFSAEFRNRYTKLGQKDGITDIGMK